MANRVYFGPREVVEIGPGVRDLKVGDRVAIEPGVPCWTNRASRQVGPECKSFDFFWHSGCFTF